MLAVQELSPLERAKKYLLRRRKDALEVNRKQLPGLMRHELVVADLRDPVGLRLALGETGLTEGALQGVVANADIGGENHYEEGIIGVDAIIGRGVLRLKWLR